MSSKTTTTIRKTSSVVGTAMSAAGGGGGLSLDTILIIVLVSLVVVCLFCSCLIWRIRKATKDESDDIVEGNPLHRNVPTPPKPSADLKNDLTARSDESRRPDLASSRISPRPGDNSTRDLKPVYGTAPTLSLASSTQSLQPSYAVGAILPQQQQQRSLQPVYGSTPAPSTKEPQVAYITLNPETSDSYMPLPANEATKGATKVRPPGVAVGGYNISTKEPTTPKF